MFHTTPLAGRRWMALAAGAVLTLALAACTSASPSASVTTSPSGIARCAVTPDASPSATIHVAGLSFGPSVTIKAGQAVVFTNGTQTHTITEGTNGKAVAGACADVPIAANQNVTVTFNQPGDYQITCKIHPHMQTAVHVT
jgi:plastocyanin